MACKSVAIRNLDIVKELWVEEERRAPVRDLHLEHFMILTEKLPALLCTGYHLVKVLGDRRCQGELLGFVHLTSKMES